ncbi:hypothetical protein PM082_014409 [Marasmius tenuissimus]|nr:hypothetical protein PM082_014409 [Marasmius tenuissimus]
MVEAYGINPLIGMPVTHSPINQDVLQSWGKPSKRPLPASQSRTHSVEEEHDSIMVFSSGELDCVDGPIDNDGLELDTSKSSSGVPSTGVVVAEPSRKLRKHRPVTYTISSDSEDGLAGGSGVHNPEPEHAYDSPTYNNTDTEQEDIEVSAMFHSMASVSERASSPLIATNDSTILFDPYKGYVPDVRF